MLEPSMNRLRARIDNRYLLVNISSKRARDISIEAMDRGERLECKSIKIALDEIADGIIRCADAPKVDE